MRIASALALAAFLGSAGCSKSRPASPSPTAADQITALQVSPAASQVTLAADGSGHYAAAVAFSAKATLGDGSTRDVTAAVAWAASDPSLTFAGASATATQPGNFKVTATAPASMGAAMASASLTVVLTGDISAAGLAPAARQQLNGTPDPTQKPTLAYPLAGSLVPANLAPMTVQLQKSDPTQSLARLSFSAPPLLSLDYYAPCESGPHSDVGCYVSLPAALSTLFAGASATTDVTLTGRLAAADGSKLGESKPITLAWALPLTGGLYFWTTVPASLNDGTTGISRYDFDGDASKPQVVYTDKGSPLSHMTSEGQNACIGCHAITHDGTKMGLTIGGSTPSDFMLLDVASMSRIALRNMPPDMDPAGFATMTTFNPDGSRMVNMYRGAFTLHGTDASLLDDGPVLATATAEAKTDPFWSPDGSWFAFVSYDPSAVSPAQYQLNGDMETGGQIWIAHSTPVSIPDQATQLVPRASGVTSYYPTISDDSQLVVFDRSSCSGPANGNGYGDGPCDGYNDPSAQLYMTVPTGGTPVALAHANSPSDGQTFWTNSWPRFSPDHGQFRGKTLYWVAYSSERPYGLQIDQSGDATIKPQLWFTAVVVDPAKPLGGDPSFAPVWLPGQNPDPTTPNGNHVPQWVVKAVAIID